MRDDLTRLDVRWNITSLVMDGEHVPGSLDGASIVITGKKFSSIGMGAAVVYDLAFDQQIDDR